MEHLITDCASTYRAPQVYPLIGCRSCHWIAGWQNQIDPAFLERLKCKECFGQLDLAENKWPETKAWLAANAKENAECT